MPPRICSIYFFPTLLDRFARLLVFVPAPTPTLRNKIQTPPIRIREANNPATSQSDVRPAGLRSLLEFGSVDTKFPFSRRSINRKSTKLEAPLGFKPTLRRLVSSLAKGTRNNSRNSLLGDSAADNTATDPIRLIRICPDLNPTMGTGVSPDFAALVVCLRIVDDAVKKILTATVGANVTIKHKPPHWGDRCSRDRIRRQCH